MSMADHMGSHFYRAYSGSHINIKGYIFERKAQDQSNS